MSFWAMLSADLVDVDDRLRNWARWANERPARGRARSAEGRYRPVGGDLDDRRALGPSIDLADALLVGRALGRLPQRELVLIKAHYLQRRRDDEIAVALHIPRREWILVARYAMYMARNVIQRQMTLARQESARYARGTDQVIEFKASRMGGPVTKVESPRNAGFVVSGVAQ